MAYFLIVTLYLPFICYFLIWPQIRMSGLLFTGSFLCVLILRKFTVFKLLLDFLYLFCFFFYFVLVALYFLYIALSEENTSGNITFLFLLVNKSGPFFFLKSLASVPFTDVQRLIDNIGIDVTSWCVHIVWEHWFSHSCTSR